MKKYGEFIEIDAEGYKVYRCPFCGEEYGLGDYFDKGILEDVSCSCGASIKEADFDKALFIKEKKYILNLLDDKGNIVSGYQEEVEGDNSDEVIEDYIYYLETYYGKKDLTRKNVDIEEVTWEE